MRLTHTLLALSCLALASAVPAFSGSVVPDDSGSVDAPARTRAVVSRVIDGNTLDAQVDGIRTPVAYLGAETPVLNQPCGREAFERNRALADGSVDLEADPAYELDQQTRRLFYAYALDGTSIDEMLIAEGLARAVRTDAAHGEQLAAVEAEAQAAARGCLWGGS
jgi:endonuclease YncB( thermonuclease family)